MCAHRTALPHKNPTANCRSAYPRVRTARTVRARPAHCDSTPSPFRPEARQPLTASSADLSLPAFVSRFCTHPHILKSQVHSERLTSSKCSKHARLSVLSALQGHKVSSAGIGASQRPPATRPCAGLPARQANALPAGCNITPGGSFKQIHYIRCHPK